MASLPSFDSTSNVSCSSTSAYASSSTGSSLSSSSSSSIFCGVSSSQPLLPSVIIPAVLLSPQTQQGPSVLGRVQNAASSAFSTAFGLMYLLSPRNLYRHADKALTPVVKKVASLTVQTVTYVPGRLLYYAAAGTPQDVQQAINGALPGSPIKAQIATAIVKQCGLAPLLHNETQAPPIIQHAINSVLPNSPFLAQVAAAASRVLNPLEVPIQYEGLNLNPFYFQKNPASPPAPAPTPEAPRADSIFDRPASSSSSSSSSTGAQNIASTSSIFSASFSALNSTPAPTPPSPAPIVAPSSEQIAPPYEPFDAARNENLQSARQLLTPVSYVFLRAKLLLLSLDRIADNDTKACCVQAVQEFVKDHKANFSIRRFLNILSEKGVVLTWREKVWLYFINFFLILGGVFEKLITSSIDMSIAKAYDLIFNQQAETLEEFSRIAHTFFENYADLAQRYNNSNFPGTREAFMVQMVRNETFLGHGLNASSIVAYFSHPNISKFLKTVLHHRFNIEKNVPWYRIDYLMTYGFYKFVLWVIDLLFGIPSLTKNVMDSTIAQMLSPAFQFSLKAELIEQLKDLITELKEDSPPSAKTFLARDHAPIYDNLRKLAVAIAKCLEATRDRNIAVPANSTLETCLQALGSAGESGVDKIFETALRKVVPNAFLTFCKTQLHPNKIGLLFQTTIKNCSKALSTHGDEITDAMKKEQNENFESTLKKLSEIILKSCIKEQVNDQLAKIPGWTPSKISSMPRNIQVTAIDLESTVIGSLRPRLQALIKSALNLMSSQSAFEGIGLHAMARNIQVR